MCAAPVTQDHSFPNPAGESCVPVHTALALCQQLTNKLGSFFGLNEPSEYSCIPKFRAPTWICVVQVRVSPNLNF